MKLFSFILTLIFVISVAIFYMFHTSRGLSTLSSYLSKQLSHEIGENLSVDVRDISLSFSEIQARMLVNDVLEVDILGDISAFDRDYDLRYHIKGDAIAFGNLRMQDRVALKGRFQGSRENFTFQVQGMALEGDVNLSFAHHESEEKDIVIKLQKINSQKLFRLFGEKPLLRGEMSLDGDIPRYSTFDKVGDIRLTLHRGGVDRENIRQLYGVEVPADFTLFGNAKLHLANEADRVDLALESSVGTISVQNAKIIEAEKKIRGHYTLESEELSKLTFLTKKRFAGAFASEGEFIYHDGLRIDGKTQSLDGEIEYYYENDTLDAKLVDVSLEKLFTSMYYPPIMIGDISGKVEIDMVKDVALVTLRSQNLRFKNNAMLERIRQASSVDIAKEIFTKSYITSTVEKGIVYYDFKAENSASHIYLLDSKMDSHQNTITSNFDLGIEGEELSGEIYGSLQSPKVHLNMSQYLKYKAKKEIDDFFGTGTSQRVKKKLEDVNIDKVKGFIKGFF